jgi:hypothetical protein
VKKLPDAVIVAYSVMCGTKKGCRSCGLVGEAGRDCLELDGVSFAAARRILRAYRTELRPRKEAK